MVTTMAWEVQAEHEEKFFQYKVVQHWSRLPAEAVNPSLWETFQDTDRQRLGWMDLAVATVLLQAGDWTR